MEKNLTIFISPKNQTLLWKIINQSILFNKLPPGERAGWFKNIVGNIYYERKTVFFDTDELVTLNKKAIYYILNKLNESQNINDPIDHREVVYKSQIINECSDNMKNTPIDPPTPIQHAYNAPYFTNLSIGDEYNNKTVIKKELYDKNASLFDRKQKEFNDLIANNTPPQIDFRMKEIDEPIEDLSVLIERCVKERNAFIGEPYIERVVEP